MNTLKVIVAFVLMVALLSVPVNQPVHGSMVLVHAQDALVGVVQPIQTAVWVRQLFRRRRLAFARMVGVADRVADDLFALCIIGVLLVACTSLDPSTALFAVAVPGKLGRLRASMRDLTEKCYEGLIPVSEFNRLIMPLREQERKLNEQVEKAQITKAMNRQAKDVQARLAAAQAKAKIENAKAKDLEVKAYADAAVSAAARAVEIAKAPASTDVRPDPRCLAYISEYEIKDASGEVSSFGTEIIKTDKADNLNRDDIRINGRTHHFSGAVRDLLENRCNEDYVVLSVENFDNAKDYITGGYLWEGHLWHVAIGVVREGGTVLILTETEHDMVKFLEGMGLAVRINSKAAGNSAAKYLKRALAHHEVWWEGTTLQTEQVALTNYTYRPIKGLVKEEITGTVYHVKFQDVGRVFKILVRADDPATDGCSHISVKMLKDLGYFTPWGAVAKAGYLAAITALTSVGEIKGHALAVNRKVQSCNNYDAVLIGNKKMLVACDDRFAFGVLQTREGHNEVFTDVQSVIHFMLEKFLHGWAIEDFSQIGQWVIEGKAKLPETTTLGKVVALGSKIPGFSASLLPKMVMKFYDLKEARINDTHDIRIRIPDAFSRYAIVDPNIIKADGSTDVRLAKLTGDQVYVNGLTQRIASHRQPNGHCQEMCLATAVDVADLGWLRNSGVIVFAPLHGIQSLSRMGGGDQDDNLIIYIRLEVVAHFEALAAYPKAERPTKADATKEAPTPTPYNHDLLVSICKVKAEQKGIGYYVNKLMVFHYWWDLSSRDAKFQPVFNALFPLFALGWGLEEIIDSVVKTGADLSHWDDFLDHFIESCKFCPRFLARRMAAQLQKGECELVDTPMDMVLANIRKDSRIYAQATKRYASKLVLTKWQDWTLARQVAYMASALMSDDVRQLADSAYSAFSTTLGKAREDMWADALKKAHCANQKALRGVLVADEYDKLEARIACSAFQAGEAAFLSKLADNPLANSALAYLFTTLHLTVSEDGLPPASCLFGFQSCELTMAMLAQAGSMVVPDEFQYEWKPEFRPVMVLREGMAKARQNDPTTFLEWKGAANSQVTLHPECLAATDGYGEELGGYRMDPFTGKPFVTKATVKLNGEFYGDVKAEHLDRLMIFVSGTCPTATLVDPNTNWASMELWVGSMPAQRAVRTTRSSRQTVLPPQDEFVYEMVDQEVPEYAGFTPEELEALEAQNQ
jgi:hypothetical protein